MMAVWKQECSLSCYVWNIYLACGILHYSSYNFTNEQFNLTQINNKLVQNVKKNSNSNVVLIWKLIISLLK